PVDSATAPPLKRRCLPRDPRSFLQHDAQAKLLGGAPAVQWELAPAAGGAVEPQDHRAGGVAVLGVAQPAAVIEVEAPFGPRLFDARHAEGVPPEVDSRL